MIMIRWKKINSSCDDDDEPYNMCSNLYVYSFAKQSKNKEKSTERVGGDGFVHAMKSNYTDTMSQSHRSLFGY
jgi:hypothetical protein